MFKSNERNTNFFVLYFRNLCTLSKEVGTKHFAQEKEVTGKKEKKCGNKKKKKIIFLTDLKRRISMPLALNNSAL